MPTDLTIRGVPDDLREAIENAAQVQGKTFDELTVEALQHELGRLALARLRRKADVRRQALTDNQIDQQVAHAVNESRGR